MDWRTVVGSPSQHRWWCTCMHTTLWACGVVCACVSAHASGSPWTQIDTMCNTPNVPGPTAQAIRHCCAEGRGRAAEQHSAVIRPVCRCCNRGTAHGAHSVCSPLRATDSALHHHRRSTTERPAVPYRVLCYERRYCVHCCVHWRSNKSRFAYVSRALG